MYAQDGSTPRTNCYAQLCEIVSRSPIGFRHLASILSPAQSSPALMASVWESLPRLSCSRSPAHSPQTYMTKTKFSHTTVNHLYFITIQPFHPPSSTSSHIAIYLMLFCGSSDDRAHVRIFRNPSKGHLCQWNIKLIRNCFQLLYFIQGLIHQRLFLQALHK